MNYDTKPGENAESENTDKEKIELGEEMYIEYEHVSNDMGGYHPVNLVLCNSSTGKHYQVLDQNGHFLHFPGIREGKWQEDLSSSGFLKAVYFVCRIGGFREGKAFFMWEVQPDGRYWEDEDGFGMTNENEIWLYSWLDKNGCFTAPFSDDKPEGLWGCML